MDQTVTAEMRVVHPGWVWGMEVTPAPYDPDRTEAGPSTFAPDRTGLANAVSASRTGVRDAEIAPAEAETVSVATAARLLGSRGERSCISSRAAA